MAPECLCSLRSIVGSKFYLVFELFLLAFLYGSHWWSLREEEKKWRRSRNEKKSWKGEGRWVFIEVENRFNNQHNMSHHHTSSITIPLTRPYPCPLFTIHAILPLPHASQGMVAHVLLNDGVWLYGVLCDFYRYSYASTFVFQYIYSYIIVFINNIISFIFYKNIYINLFKLIFN